MNKEILDPVAAAFTMWTPRPFAPGALPAAGSFFMEVTMKDPLRITEWQEPLKRIKKSKYGKKITMREALQAEIDARPTVFEMATNDETGEIAIARRVAL